LSIANKVVGKYRSNEVCTYAVTFLAVELDIPLAKSNCAYCNSSKNIAKWNNEDQWPN
jgi:hypothetical protein